MTSELRRSCLLVLLTVVLALGAASAAHAQEGDAAYKELIDQALVEFRHKNWPEARVLFRRAHERAPSARTLRGMGIVSYEMRDYVQAVRDLDAALLDARQPLTEQQRGECQTLLARSRTFVGVYVVKVTPADAALTVDGAPLMRESDGRVLLSFGEHELRGSAPGHEAATVRVGVQGGEDGELALQLPPSQAALPAVEAAVVEPQPAKVPPPARGEPHGLRGGGLRYTWVALGASALFAGGAVAAYYLGEAEIDDLAADCAKQGGCQEGDVDLGTVDRYERLIAASAGLSGAALVAAVVLATFEWPRERALSVGLSPSSLVVRKEF